MTEPDISLDEVKLHCRIDHDDEDSLLQVYVDAALEVCQKHIGKQFSADLDFTPAIKVGCLMYVAHLYDGRTIVSEVAAKEVPFTISSLWNVYRDPGVY